MPVHRLHNTDDVILSEGHMPQWLTRVNIYKSFIQHFSLSVAMETIQNEEVAQLFYVWWRTT